MHSVSVVGLGYVGLPLALAFEAVGLRVWGIDHDLEKVQMLNRKKSYLTTVHDNRLLFASGFHATTKKAVIAESAAVIVCVPTPIDENNEPNLSYLKDTCQQIAEHLNGQLVVIESTSYPGTTEEIVKPILDSSGKHYSLAYSPEREDPGNPHYNVFNTPKIVGADDKLSLDQAIELYEKVCKTVVPVSSCKVAEMAKCLENVYRMVNISLVNELKVFCDCEGIDIWEVIEAAKSKPFGFQAFYPGPGTGGHCLLPDSMYLAARAKQIGAKVNFIELAGQVNKSMTWFVFKKARQALKEVLDKDLKDSKVLVIGLAYKPNINDTRESPAFPLIKELKFFGADVCYHDPFVPVFPKTRNYEFDLASIDICEDHGIDCAILVTDHDNLNYLEISKFPVIVDTRNRIPAAFKA